MKNYNNEVINNTKRLKITVIGRMESKTVKWIVLDRVVAKNGDDDTNTDTLDS